MSAIDLKYQQLRKNGVDLGKPRGAETAAHSGGRMRKYERGTIYWHKATGAHEVHGAILSAYQSLGGPGPNRATGQRELGYPTSDEFATSDRKHRRSTFEWGTIVWVSGHGAGILSKDFYKYWQLIQEAHGPIGYPISAQFQLVGGQAAFFEYGCVYAGAATRNLPIRSELELPRIGQPHIAVPEGKKLLIPDAVSVEAPPAFKGSATTLRRLFAQVWDGRLGLRPTGKPTAAPIPLRLTRTVGLPRGGRWSLGTTADLEDRTLYDIVFIPPTGKPSVLAPHAVYVKSSWKSCGLMHMTDLHVSRRVDHFRDKLAGASHDEFVNYNDGVRSAISYANRLYKQGKLDAIIATGDLIDYIYEADDSPDGGGNWDFFEKLLRGQAPGEGQTKGEALLVPIFMSGGNHDYRRHPYELLFDIDVRAWSDPEVGNYKSHNLTKEDAKRLQGGKKKKVSSGGAMRMVEIDKQNPAYFRRMVKDASYVVRLGQHRLVMIDSRWDLGVLTSEWDAIMNKAGFGSNDERNFSDGHPNSEGFTKADVELVTRALAETKTGVVLVGVHAPPVNTAGNEYAYFFRETARAHADLDDVRAFLRRRGKWVGAYVSPNSPGSWIYPKGWLHKGEACFKKGNLKGVDYGISKGKVKEFLEACAGRGQPRSVDAVFCGHVHKNVEFRLTWDEQAKFRFYMDFYTQNPDVYYPSNTADGKVYLDIVAGAPVDAKPAPVTDHRSGGFAPLELLAVPPYGDPLDESRRPGAWWRKHRPLVIQTASSGPMDSYQRLDKERHMPSPSFRGVRTVQIENNVITRMEYVMLRPSGVSQPTATVPSRPGSQPPPSKPGSKPGSKPTAPRSQTNVPAKRGTKPAAKPAAPQKETTVVAKRGATATTKSKKATAKEAPKQQAGRGRTTRDHRKR